MAFGLSRQAMLNLIGDAMAIPGHKRSSLLGRFQHLQRLQLIKGINPGRGTAANYRPHQVLIVAVAFQMLQLGLSPERVVNVIQHNQDRLRLAMSLATDPGGNDIPVSMIWFDPAVLQKPDEAGEDWADATFHYGGAGSGPEAFSVFFVNGLVPRMAFINLTGILWSFVAVLQGIPYNYEKVPIDGDGHLFLLGLRDWYEKSQPDSLE